MHTIVPCREVISERFPIASFTVRVPEHRLYEVVCATDPRLFHTDYAGYRSPSNFYSSRTAGLIPARRDGDAFIVPPDALRRFAGARRIYYALGSYAGRAGRDPRFSISPAALAAVPSIGVSPDFTGKALDRARIGAVRPPSARYGGAGGVLRWGGDAVLEAERSASADRRVAGESAYDDGYDPQLWRGVDAGLEPDGGGDEDDADIPATDVDSGDDVEDGAQAYGFAGGRSDGYGFGEDDEPGHAYAYDEDDEDDEDSGRVRAYEDDDEEDDGYGYGYDDPPHAHAYADAPATPTAGTELGSDEYEDGADYNSRHAGAPPPAAQMPAGPDPTDAALAPGDYEDGADARRRSAAPPAVPPSTAPAMYEDDGRYGFGGAPAYRPPPRRAPVYAMPNGQGRHPAYREHEEAEQLPVGPASRPLGVTPLTIEEKVRILRVVGQAESGDAGYASTLADVEYNDPTHPAYQKVHIGLSWGFIHFTQRSGGLGKVLAKAKDRAEQLRPPHVPEFLLPEEHRFEQLFGADHQALLETTDPQHTPSPDDRVAKVGDALLWEEPWLSRFAYAGKVPYVQAAQNEVAVVDYFDQVVPLARRLGIRTARGLALLLDRAIHMGVGGGRAWVMEAIGSVRTEADREKALVALGYASTDVAAFQRDQGLPADGRWGPMTHAAMIAALRALGGTSPITVRTGEQATKQLAEAARGTAFETRMSSLFNNRKDFDDAITYELG